MYYSKIKQREYAEEMRKIRDYCINNNITISSSGDSYYFDLNGKTYRVSNHSPNIIKNGKNDIYITASKMRIVEIYEDLKNGYELDSRGRRITTKLC
jgi:hypothetical protein